MHNENERHEVWLLQRLLRWISPWEYLKFSQAEFCRSLGCERGFHGNVSRRLQSRLFYERSQLQVSDEKPIFLNEIFVFKVGCLHPIACTRSGSGFPSNATLFWIFYSVTATCFGRMTIFKREYFIQENWFLFRHLKLRPLVNEVGLQLSYEQNM
jgi:hypothetical protein